MSQSLALILSSIFSFSGYLWGYILGIIAIEEVEESHKIIQNVCKVILSLTSIFTLYLGLSLLTISSTRAICLIILTIILGLIIWTKFFEKKEMKKTIAVIICIVLIYSISIISQISQFNILILNSLFLLYSISYGINIHHFKKQKWKRKKP